MIHPNPAPASPSESPQLLVYELVATETLPAFNPTMTIKHLILTEPQTRAFNRAIARIRPLLMPSFVGGYLLRIAATFSSADIGRVLAPISPILQLPVVLLVQLGFRYDFVRILIRNFEFGFLVLTASVWVVCFGFSLQGARAVILPLCWLEFVNLLLIETYFRDSGNVVFAALIAICYLFAMIAGVSIDAIDRIHYQDFLTGAAHSLTSKDILVNAMGTIVTLMIRLVYRKLKILKRQRRSPESTWTQSIGCRCRIALEPQRGPSATPEPSSSIRSPEPPSQPSSSLLQMRLVHDSQRFDPSNSLIPRLTITNSTPLTWWQLQLLYSGGVLGFALSVFAVYPGSQEYPEALDWGSALGLVITTAFVIPFLSCSQRQLLCKLCTSFDFVFLYAQQIAAHVDLCDVLAWKWTHCCGLLSSLLWTHWVLTLDTIPPICKERLGLRTEFAVPVLVTRMAMQFYFSCEMLLWDRHELQNRLLLDHMWLGYRVKFYVMPFLFSRMITVFIWCVRLVYCICTRRRPNELIIILGNVEYDYVQWEQAQQQQQRVAQAQSLPLGAGSETGVTMINPVRHTSSIQLLGPVMTGPK